MSPRERRASGSTVPRVEDSVRHSSVVRAPPVLAVVQAWVVERQGVHSLDTVHASFSTWVYLYLTFFFFSMCVHDTYIAH